MKKHVILILFVAVGLFGCMGEPKIDGTSEEAFKNSIKQVAEKLDGPQREELKKALQIIALDALNVDDVMKGVFAGQAVDPFKARTELNGMTAGEVIERSKAIVAEREAKMREQALQEIAALEAKLLATDEARKELDKFEIVTSRFFKHKGEYDYKEKPFIFLRVKNGTSHSISRFYCEAVLSTPGRSVPWVEDTFNYDVPGGIEPGEVGQWALTPGLMSKWGRVEAPEDAVLTVTVYRLDGPGGEELVSAHFPESKMKRLEELRAKYAQ